MNKRIKLFLWSYLYWVSLFVATKILFLLYHFDKMKELEASDWLKIPMYGLRMDLAMAGYIAAVTGLIMLVFSFFKGKTLYYVLNGFVVFITLLACLLTVTDMELYFHWGYRLDISPLLYMSNDAEAAASTGNDWILVRQGLYGLVLCMGFLFLYFKWIGKRVASIQKGGWKEALVTFFLAALMFLPIRSSLGDTPLNAGFVYYHKSSLFANHAAVNVMWNFFNSLGQKDEISIPNVFPSEKVAHNTAGFFDSDTATNRLTNLDQPNFVVIIMENFNARFVETLGGKPGLTPNFEALIKEGILFENFYANGNRTEQGIMAVINGWPPFPTLQLIKYPNITEKMPYINKSFKRNGYETSYTSGYSHFFANFSSYLGNAQFDKVTSKEDYDPSIPTGVWGVHDYHIFERLVTDINGLKEPFLQVGVSQSNHEPFDAPMEIHYKGEEDDMEVMFYNSMRYADMSLGMFIERAKKEDWWANTVVAITADHANGWVLPEYKKQPDSNNRVPLLLLGGALNQRDTIISTYGSQNDLARTLLAQIGDPAPEFKFGKNILSKNPQSFAFYTFNNGFGYASDSMDLSFSNDAGTYLRKSGQYSEQNLIEGKALMQRYFDEVKKLKK